MRLLRYSGGFCHRKNEEGFQLMANSVGAEYVISSDPSIFAQEWDIVFLPSGFIEPEKFPNARLIIYGPHNFVFPQAEWIQLNYTGKSNIFYNVLSHWNKKVYNETGEFEKHINMAVLPFAVDVERFKPIEPRPEAERDCFIYFKARDVGHLEKVRALCDARGLTYEVIKYGSYNEEHYRHVLASSKFGIWIGSHESQGFAAQEALASDVPLVVWDASSMFYEINGGREQYGHLRGRYELRSTSMTTWDPESCGIIADEGTIGDAIGKMVVDYGKYRPRQFIVRELAPAVCMERWIKLGIPK